MSIRCGSTIRFRRSFAFLTMAVAVAQPPSQASAQGLFDLLFGGLRPAPRADPAQISAEPAGPRPSTGERSERQFAGSGQPVAFCVRLCDGRFFPIQRNTGAPPGQTCNALCPASQTKIFSGSGIDAAVPADGTRYSGLHNAFLYRNRLVKGCTCNGKDNFGLASVAANPDPTLRAGDIIATQNGLTVVSGSSPRRGVTQIANATVGQ
jgi:uncharacterized protein DUF2865